MRSLPRRAQTPLTFSHSPTRPLGKVCPGWCREVALADAGKASGRDATLDGGALDVVQFNGGVKFTAVRDLVAAAARRGDVEA